MCAQNIGKANVVHPQNTYFPMVALAPPYNTLPQSCKIDQYNYAVCDDPICQSCSHAIMQSYEYAICHDAIIP